MPDSKNKENLRSRWQPGRLYTRLATGSLAIGGLAIGSLVALLALGACSSGETQGACELGDLDGIIGGDYQFEVTVNDLEFSPKILKAQNSANVRLKLTNSGTRPHSFALECLPTPNDDGCPQEACFDDEARIMRLGPGESVTIEFPVPRAEGLYEFKSTLAGDEPLTGQFIVS